MNDKVWIRYLHKKRILKEGLQNFVDNEKEMKEFKAMLYRLHKSDKPKDYDKIALTLCPDCGDDLTGNICHECKIVWTFEKLRNIDTRSKDE